MRATRFKLSVQCIALAAIAFASCTDREDAVDLGNNLAGMANEPPGGEHSGGTAAVHSGGAPSVAGTAAIIMAGQPAGMAGEGTTPGCERPSPDGPYSVELGICARLEKATDLAKLVMRSFETRLYMDCRSTWLAQLSYADGKRHEYLNELQKWNVRFWGCNASPVDDFPLVYGSPPLSQGDADIVIEHYLAAALAELELTEKELCEMRVALERLAQATIASDSSEPSQPRCDDPGTGGAGGMTGSAGEGGRHEPVGGSGAGESAAGQGGEGARAGNAGTVGGGAVE